MSRRKVLGAGIVVAVVAVLAVAAYIVMAQWNTEPLKPLPVSSSCLGSYTPSGYTVTVNPKATAEICFPHNRPFRLVVGYMGPAGGATVAICGATGYVMASEIQCNVSWVGQNGNGTTTVGCAPMGSGTTILTVGSATVQLSSSGACSENTPLVGTPGYSGHALSVVNSGTSPACVTLMY